MQDPKNILTSFATISLAEMEAVELMNRKDTKYFFDGEKLPQILTELQPNYKVLSIDGNKVFHYRNIYFDTPDFFCYYQHHNQRINRYKIRIRQYVESNLNFLEVKFKTNTKRTIKTRMRVPEFTETLSDDMKKFLREKTPFDPDVLVPTLRNDFERFTLVSNDLKERATIDNGLVLMVKDNKRVFEKLCIAELKHEVTSSGSLFKLAMRDNLCPEMRISKYSVGAAFMYDDLKQNNWKPKKLRINRIEYE
ncbi:MAG: polyphosphate polymerase domain-containing protein [Chitinophagales bacterium]